MDERFKLHRLYATRFSAIIGIVMIGFWFSYEYLFNQLLRWDLFSVMIAMALAKISAMFYYQRTD